MLSAIRKRIHVTPATVIAGLALVFAMTGGAYAAKKYLITSTKQISPNVLKALQGKAGAAGANGAPGAAGAQGAQGPAGAAGPKGDAGAGGKEGPQGPTGAKGTTGSTGPAGAKGATGEPWPAGGTLPVGKTETGAWTLGPATGIANVAISFPIPLAAGLGEGKEHVVTAAGKEAVYNWETGTLEETAAPTECPGSISEPKAKSGNLCVYIGSKIGASVIASNLIYKLSNRFLTEAGEDGSTDSSGARLVGIEVGDVEAGISASAWGAWAVTG